MITENSELKNSKKNKNYRSIFITIKSWFSIINNKMNLIDDNDNNDSPSKEAYYYKNKFIEYFGRDRLNIIPHYWQPNFINNNVYIDPSARVLNIY